MTGPRARTATVVLTAGLAVCVAAAPVGAAPRASGAQLSAYPLDATFTRLTMSAFYPMTQSDAQGYLNNVGAGGMEFLLFADDDGDRDSVRQRFWAPGAYRFDGYTIAATSTGLSSTLVVTLPNGVLDEDDGTDEFYVKATFVDGDGGRRSQFSNAVAGNWP